MMFIVMGACGTDPPAPREQARAGRAIAEGLFGNAAWTSEGIFAGMAGSADPVAGYDQVVEILDDGATRRMDVRERSGCRLNHVGGLNTTLRGQLVYTATCVGPAFAPEEEVFDIRILDPETGRDRPLRCQAPIPRVGVMGFRHLGRDRGCRGQVVSLSVRPGQRRWARSVSVGRYGRRNHMVERAGTAGPVRRRMRFQRRQSSAVALPRRELARLVRQSDGEDRPWALLLSPSTGGRARVLVGGLIDPATATWSPDGSHLAFTADRDGSAGRALWLLELETLQVELLVSDANGVIAWSPDGRELLVGDDIGDVTFPQPQTLTIYEVG